MSETAAQLGILHSKRHSTRKTTTFRRKMYTRNPYSQLHVYRRRTHKKKKRVPNAMTDYLTRVRVILEKVNDAEDREENIETILGELNTMGHVYFGHHKYPYHDKEEVVDEPIEALTKKQFMKEYEEETGEPYEEDNDEASFSDAFRHAALIDVDTLKVLPIELWGAHAADFAKSDYVFTWKMIQELPAKLAGSRLVAIHFDTEDEGQIFFPIPG